MKGVVVVLKYFSGTDEAGHDGAADKVADPRNDEHSNHREPVHLQCDVTHRSCMSHACVGTWHRFCMVTTVMLVQCVVMPTHQRGATRLRSSVRVLICCVLLSARV